MSTPTHAVRLPPVDHPLCDTPWPPSRHDIHLVRCVLLRGHRSEEHCSGPLWAGHAGITWEEGWV